MDNDIKETPMTPESAPMAPEMTPEAGDHMMHETPPRSGGSTGPLVGIVIIIIILIVGALYFWGSHVSTLPGNGTTAQLDAQSDSDDLADIEADTLNTDLSSLDADLSAIQGELDAQ